MKKRQSRFFLILFFLSIALSLFPATPAAQAAPRAATPLIAGRTYDQAHDWGKIDWSGSVLYEALYHRDGTSLPAEEGGTACGGGCWENVTRINSGASISGIFDRDVTYFEGMLAYEYQGTGVGGATINACGSSLTANLRKVNNSAAGFNSFIVTVPAGCRTWSISASGGFAHLRSIDVLYVDIPPTVSGSVQCDQDGANGWCINNATLQMSASDPQGYAVTIAGSVDGVPLHLCSRDKL